LSDKEQQIENGKDVGRNKEAKKGISKNYQQSDSERETHGERTCLSQERREEMSDTQIIIIKYP
jgi:hypothetical protein